MKTQLIIFCFMVIMLNACGGGSSKSGGQIDKNLTYCVIETTEDRTNPAIQGLVFRDYTWTNNCGVTVNLSLYQGLGPIEPVISLVNGAVHSQTRLNLLRVRYIACRPPSIGIDGDLDTAFIQIECS